MKKLFSPPVLMFSFGILALAFSFASFSLANQAGQNQAINPGGNGGIVVAGVDQNSPNPTCVDNWRDWPSSRRFNPGGQWNLSGFPAYSAGQTDGVIRQFIDINGDGLQDFVYSNKYVVSPVNQFEGCVLMNNGSGWTSAYKCLVQRDPEGDHAWTYYGDCAAN